MFNYHLTCKICGKDFKHLGSHLWHKHKVLAREYKMEFGLPINYHLTNNFIRKKQQEASRRNYQLVVGKNLLIHGKKYQFKPGVKHKSTYISSKALKDNIERIIKVNKKKRSALTQCPVCKIKFNHMESHLYNKHNLIKA